MTNHGALRAARATGMAAAALLTACGSGAVPGPFATPATATASQTSAVTPQAGATVDELVAVAAMAYPPTTNGQGNWTTCEAGHSGASVFEACPVTPRLRSRLNAVVSGVPSAPDPLGGGQQAYWDTRTMTADVAPTGGVAHVTLGPPAAGPPERKDLVIVRSGGQLLIDDIFCTGVDPAASSVYGADWLTRYSTC
ncbi:MAG: hypothetical protein QOE72_4965 [Chloroflexota bacterium]|jgi:hypothetical protein|nr:hypothetical protein [Chloroflexota bacterium]